MIRWGILSTAKINDNVLAGAAGLDDVRFVAVASRDGARAEAYARERGIDRTFGSYEALLADPEIDAVYISLPNSLHVEWARRALEAGKHVLVEKPLTRRPEEIGALFDLADRVGRICMEGFMWRHNPQTMRLAALLAEGAIGEVRLVRASFSFLGDNPRDIRLAAELDGGAAMDLGCYCISGCRLVAGEPRRITAQQRLTAGGVDMRTVATLEFDDGVLGLFHCAMDMPDQRELEIVGSEGSIRVRDPWICSAPGIEIHRGGEVQAIAIHHANSYGLEVANLSAAIRGEAEPLLGRADALAQARTLEAVYRSAAEGRTVEIGG